MLKELACSLLAVLLFASAAGAQFLPLQLAQSEKAPAPAASGAPAGSAAPATQPATASVQLAVPASQPVNITLNTADADKETLGEVLGNTRVGQLFQGKKRVTLDDVKDPLFWIDTVKDLIVALLGFIPRLIVAVLFLVVFWLVYRATRKIVTASMGKAAVDPSIRDMLGHLLKWSIMGFGLVIACNQIGIQIAALLTGVSIIGLAVGFAAQETLANFIAGVVIFWDKPFKIGDWVEIDGTFGHVQRVTFRSTRLLDLNGEVIIFPNTHMLSSRLSNHSTHPETRVTVPIGIAYKESIDAARAALLATTVNDPRLLKDPAPTVVVAECADSSVNLLFRFWLLDEAEEKKIIFEYMEKAKKALDAANIQIPFPHVQLLLEDTPAIHTLAPNGMRKAG
jgi:small conductance mechanosensitive channel